MKQGPLTSWQRRTFSNKPAETSLTFRSVQARLEYSRTSSFIPLCIYLSDHLVQTFKIMLLGSTDIDNSFRLYNPSANQPHKRVILLYRILSNNGTSNSTELTGEICFGRSGSSFLFTTHYLFAHGKIRFTTMFYKKGSIKQHSFHKKLFCNFQLC